MSMMIHRGKKRRLEREDLASHDIKDQYTQSPILKDDEDNVKHYDEQPKKQHSKTDINRMSVSELQNLAAESGVENAFEKSGGELKKLLIEKFGL